LFTIIKQPSNCTQFKRFLKPLAPLDLDYFLQCCQDLLKCWVTLLAASVATLC